MNDQVKLIRSEIERRMVTIEPYVRENNDSMVAFTAYHKILSFIDTITDDGEISQSYLNKIAELQNDNNKLIYRVRKMEECHCEAVEGAIACIRSVKVLVENQGGTHRDRDFQNEAIVKYIDRIIAKLGNLTMDIKEDYPF